MIQLCKGVVLFAGVWWSVAGAGTTRITWSSSVEEVARRNAQMQALREDLKAAQESVKARESAFLPQVSTSLIYRYGGSDAPVGSFARDTFNDPFGNWSVGLRVEQSVFSGWADQARVDQAKLAVRKAEWALQELRSQLSSDLKVAYAQLGFAQKAIELQEDIMRRRRENLRLVELRFESGRENKGSVLLSNAYLSQAAYEAQQARHARLVAQAQLARILGREEQQDLQTTDEVPVSLPAKSLPDFKALALASIAYRRAATEEEDAQISLTLARASAFPTLGVTGEYGRQGEDFFPSRDSWSVALAMSYPLFTGGLRRAEREAASNRLQATRERSENLQRQLIAQLHQTYVAWIEADERMRVEGDFLKAAQLRAEIARSKYNNGLISFEDWDQIESELVTRQRSMLSSQRDRVTAEASFELAQGKGVIP